MSWGQRVTGYVPVLLDGEGLERGHRKDVPAINARSSLAFGDLAGRSRAVASGLSVPMTGPDSEPLLCDTLVICAGGALRSFGLRLPLPRPVVSLARMTPPLSVRHAVRIQGMRCLQELFDQHDFIGGIDKLTGKPSHDAGLFCGRTPLAIPGAFPDLRRKVLCPDV